MTPPLTPLAQQATIRLVPAAYFEPPVLRGLVDSDEEAELLARLEGLTSGRLRAEREGLADLDPRELAFRARAARLRGWGATAVNAAFTHARPGGNRFNDDRRGAWYCAFDDLTAIEEVAFHRTRELAYADEWTDEMIYQAHLADFIGEFPDLRETKSPPPCLHEDPEAGYPAGQALARALRDEGHGGLVYPSVRRRGGVCFVAFEPQIVQNVRPGARWLLAWEGGPHFTATPNP